MQHKGMHVCKTGGSVGREAGTQDRGPASTTWAITVLRSPRSVPWIDCSPMIHVVSLTLSPVTGGPGDVIHGHGRRPSARPPLDGPTGRAGPEPPVTPPTHSGSHCQVQTICVLTGSINGSLSMRSPLQQSSLRNSRPTTTAVLVNMTKLDPENVCVRGPP